MNMPKGKIGYESDEQKEQHFKDVVETAIVILDRQLAKIAKLGKGRTYIYSEENITTLVDYLHSRIEETEQSLRGTKLERKPFAF